MVADECNGCKWLKDGSPDSYCSHKSNCARDIIPDYYEFKEDKPSKSA